MSKLYHWDAGQPEQDATVWAFVRRRECVEIATQVATVLAAAQARDRPEFDDPPRASQAAFVAAEAMAVARALQQAADRAFPRPGP